MFAIECEAERGYSKRVRKDTGKENGAMFEYFWKQQDDIPKGLGYPMFGRIHLISLAVTLALVALFTLLFFRQSRKKQKRILKGIPVFMVFAETFKDLCLVHIHHFGLGYLPLHLCSLGIFVFLLREYLPMKKAKDFFGEIMYKKESDRFSVFCQCKDNLDFVIGVLKSYIDNHQDPSTPKVIYYSPREFTYIYDVGKFQTEVLKAKRNIETLLWIAKISKGEEIELYQECIKRLNYVYSHIAKNR